MADKFTMGELLQLLERKLTSSDYLEAERMVRDLAGNPDEGENERPRPGGAMDRRHSFAMDSRHPGRIVADRDMAIAECATVVPREILMACDSAASVFRTALGHMGVRTCNLHESALPVMFRSIRQNGSGAAPAPDARGTADFARRFPDAARIRSV